MIHISKEIQTMLKHFKISFFMGYFVYKIFSIVIYEYILINKSFIKKVNIPGRNY